MRARQRTRAVVAVLALFVVAGCGSDGPKMHPVRGRVELAGGNVADLAGAGVEAALDSDPTVRASGVIAEDGSFRLETLHAGVIRRGAQEGNYKARIVPGDDEDKQARKRVRQALPEKYRQFQTSGLTFQVPTDGEVVLKVSPR